MSRLMIRPQNLVQWRWELPASYSDGARCDPLTKSSTTAQSPACPRHWTKHCSDLRPSSETFFSAQKRTTQPLLLSATQNSLDGATFTPLFPLKFFFVFLFPVLCPTSHSRCRCFTFHSLSALHLRYSLRPSGKSGQEIQIQGEIRYHARLELGARLASPSRIVVTPPVQHRSDGYRRCRRHCLARQPDATLVAEYSAVEPNSRQPAISAATWKHGRLFGAVAAAHLRTARPPARDGERPRSSATSSSHDGL